MFFPNPHLAEEAIFPYNLICMVQTELHNHIPLQEPKFYIPLESVGCLFVAYCHEFCNKKS